MVPNDCKSDLPLVYLAQYVSIHRQRYIDHMTEKIVYFGVVTYLRMPIIFSPKEDF